MRKFFLVLISIIFIPTALVSLILFDFNLVALSADFYKQALAEANAYERVLNLDPALVYKSWIKGEAGAPVFIKGPSETAWFLSLISKEALRETAERNINTFFNGVIKQGQETFILDLLPLKEGMLKRNTNPFLAAGLNETPAVREIALSSDFLKGRDWLARLSIISIVLAIVSLLFLALTIFLKTGKQGKLRLAALLLFLLSLPLFVIFAIGSVLPTPDISGNVAVLSEIITDVFHNLKSGFFAAFLFEGLTCFVLAVILFAISFLIKKEANESN